MVQPQGFTPLKFLFQAQCHALTTDVEVADPTLRALIPAISVPEDKPSIAVLPFANLSGDRDQDYFADGMTDDLITSLSKLADLLIIGRQSVFVYKASNKDAREIARELGVRYLVEGSIRRSEQRVRINAQLVEADHGQQVWSEKYDRDLQDIFAVQDDVSQRIAEALEVKFSDAGSRSLLRPNKINVKAHDLLLCGLERYWEYTIESIEAAQAIFVKALEVDPNYATAHAWMARAYLYRYSTCYWDRPELQELGFRHACKAMELDPRSPYVHSIMGWAHYWRGDGPEALRESRRAVEMEPNNADGHLFLSIAQSSSGLGDESVVSIYRAMRLNPHPTTFYFFALGVARFSQCRYKDAEAAFKAGVELSPGFTPSWEFLAAICGLTERLEEAASYRQTILERQSVEQVWSRWHKYFLDNGLWASFLRGIELAGFKFVTELAGPTRTDDKLLADTGDAEKASRKSKTSISCRAKGVV